LATDVFDELATLAQACICFADKWNPVEDGDAAGLVATSGDEIAGGTALKKSFYTSEKFRASDVRFAAVYYTKAHLIAAWLANSAAATRVVAAFATGQVDSLGD